jgi:hypothetical protein
MRKILFVFLFISLESYGQNIPNEMFESPNTPIVAISGFINTSAVVRSQDKSYSGERLPDSVVDKGVVDNTKPGTYNRFSRKYGIVNDSEIYIKAGAMSESGLKYGAIVELEADLSQDGRSEGLNADKSFIFIESRVGKFEFGNNLAVNQKIKVGPALFARAAGGINGKYLEHINFSMLTDSSQVPSGSTSACSGGASATACANIKLPRFILIPQSPIGHGGYAKGFYNRSSDNDYTTNNAGDLSTNYSSFNRNRSNIIRNGSFGELEDASKISYYTARLSGWQSGVSFTPDSGDSGTSYAISGADSGDIKNVVSLGTNYAENFGNLGFAVSLSGEYGKFENSKSIISSDSKRNDLKSYDVGFMATYFGFTFGGSYGSWGKSLQPKTGIYSCDYNPKDVIGKQTCTVTSDAATSQSQINRFKNAYYYTGGVAYEFGPVAISATYLSSEFQKNKYSALSVGADYKLAKGLMPYVEVTKFEFQSNQPRYFNSTSSSVVDHNLFSNSARQVRDNTGYVALVGILLAF